MRHFPKPVNAHPGDTWLRNILGGRSMTRHVLGVLLAGASLLPAFGAQPASAAAYDPLTDPYSMAAITATTGATAWWNAGFTGQGVDVAVIDTGVSPVPGLDAPGKIIHGPDLSLESQAPNLTRLDTNGHGTFMAGLIAGKDAALTKPYANAPATAYRGMAPDARIVSVKVGTADGGVDVTQVIAAINWVVDHKNDPGMNIRVLNLSYGTNSTLAYELSPLAFAAERAWKAGIVVIVAGGNYGFQNLPGNAPSLSSPGNDRWVVAVGSADTMGTPAIQDDTVPSFSPWSGRGGNRNVDLVAPGAHTQGLRVPNSHTDVNHPEGLLGTRYFRGSGTSQSTAIMSGAAALILQRFPAATPDQVKMLLMTNSQPINGNNKGFGSGELQMAKTLNTGLPNFVQSWPWSTGTGSIELTRGTDHIARDGFVLTGEKDIFGKPWTASLAGSSWSGGVWNGSTWSGSSWSGSSWSGSSWSGSSWSGSSWSGSSWSGSSWSGSSWSGSSWSGSSWSGASWSGGTWSGGTWN